MSFSEDEIRKTASLARLSVSNADCAFYAGQLGSILQLVEQMNQVDTEEIAPMAHPRDQTLRLRDDTVTESDNRALFQSIAPQTENGLYLVPKVIEP